MSRGGPAGTPSSAEGIDCRASGVRLGFDCEELALRELRVLQCPDLARSRWSRMVSHAICHLASWAPVITDELREARKTLDFQVVTLGAELLRGYACLQVLREVLVRCGGEVPRTVVGHPLKGLLAHL